MCVCVCVHLILFVVLYHCVCTMSSSKAALNRLQKHYNFLVLLSKAKTKRRRRELLEIATSDQIKAVCECVKNVMSGNIPGISQNAIKQFKKYQECICKLISTNKNISSKKRKNLLIQKGGFLPALLGPVIGIAGSLIADLIAKNI